jgi:1,4-dihydroxy-2-naphthoyl-CoA hydrolase
MIWFDKNIRMEDFTDLGKDTMGAFIGIEWVEIGSDFIKARMPVDHRTKQPYGLLHGGASCVLAETIGSVASAFVIDPSKYNCVGLEINANHLRSAKDGFVTGIAKPIHLGKSTHVWDIRIHDDNEKLICISRLTVAVIEKKYELT